MSDVIKEVTFGKEARQRLIDGIEIISKAIISTYGPRSRNVIIQRKNPGPHIVHDGVTVASNIVLEDPIQDTGAQLIHEASQNTNTEAGDGTTTVALLASELIIKGNKLTSTDIMDSKLGSMNPMELQKRLSGYSDLICKRLTEMAIPAKKREIYQRVAVISSASEEIGKVVADAIEAVKSDGVVMVEKNRGTEDSLEIKRGFEFDRGYLSPYFVNKGDRYTTEYDDAVVLVTDFSIRNLSPLGDLIGELSNKNTPMVIIAETVEGEALEKLATLNVKGIMPIVAVSAPEYAETRRQMLEDIALATGARFISSELGDKLEDVVYSDLGQVSSVYISQSVTKIVPKIEDDELKERVETVKNQLKDETNQVRRGKLEKRLGMLAGKVAVISVGGSTQVEVNEKYERYVDAVNSTKAAISDGILSGGGIALATIASELFNSEDADKRLVYEALNAPIKKLIFNSGLDSNLIEQVDLEKGIGIDVVTGKAVNMIEAGIIDPVKVTISAVKNAFSVAGVTLTTDSVITDKKSDVQKMELVK